MALISYTDLTSDKQLTLSEFVTALASAYRIPKYQIKVSYAFEAVFYTVLNRKIYFLHRLHGVYRIGFMHTSVVKRNYIPLLQENLNHALSDRRR